MDYLAEIGEWMFMDIENIFESISVRFPGWGGRVFFVDGDYTTAYLPHYRKNQSRVL